MWPKEERLYNMCVSKTFKIYHKMHCHVMRPGTQRSCLWVDVRVIVELVPREIVALAHGICNRQDVAGLPVL